MAADARADLTDASRGGGGDLGRLLGGRLRRQRQALQLTLAEVAGRADVSAGYLSTIETGAAVPSLPVLARLARAVGLTLAEVLRGSAVEGVTTGRIDQPGEATMTPESSRLEVVRQRAEARSQGQAPLPGPEGDVFAYVLEGAITVVVDGEATELAEGDAMHCVMPGAVSWVTDATDALVVWVTRRT